MGMTSFLHKLETLFLHQLEDKDIPAHIDPKDGEAVKAWFHEAFGVWFLKHREDLLAREWVKRGWAERTLKPVSGELKETYRVKPECAERIEEWLQDEID